MSTSSEEVISLLLAMDEEQRYAHLGEQLSAGASGLSRRVLAALGREWLKENLPKLRSAICHDKKVAKLRNEDGRDTAALVSAVADAVAPFLHVPSVATVAVLLVTYGLTKICSGQDA